MRSLLLCCLALLSACASAPPPQPLPSTATVPASLEEVRGRLDRELRSLGLGPTVTSGGLTASSRGVPGTWADCPRLLIHDRSDFATRSDWAEPEGLTAEVTVRLEPVAGGTAVTVAPRYAASYRDIFRNLPVQGACPSSSTLEQRLLEAARG
jgi:hypothetical protein